MSGLIRSLQLSETQSFFLFGARGTGKSTLLEQQIFPKLKAKVAPYFLDLLDPDTEEHYSLKPNLLKEQLKEASLSSETIWIVIDEVQKIPALLDVVQQLMKNKNLRFALTGSSARKLKRGAANLLGGRAIVHSLWPLTAAELGDRFSLKEALEWGTLPQIYQTQDSPLEKARYLKSYVQTYLKEEVVAEQLVRDLVPFRRFLAVAAQMNEKIINFAAIARDVGVDTKTVQTYFQILEDTYLGFFLEPYDRSVRKRQKQAPKFYWFDPGVKRALEQATSIPLQESTSAYGNAFEHWILLEFIKTDAYRETDFRFSYLRTKDDAEIDLIVERPGRPKALIEIKSSSRIDDVEIRRLERLAKAFKKDPVECFFICREETPRRSGLTQILPWQDCIQKFFE